MRPIYKIPSATTVNALVAEVYDVVDPRTGSTDVERRDGAAQALRDLNASLPVDESTVDPASIP